jgi:hypothetical protein
MGIRMWRNGSCHRRYCRPARHVSKKWGCVRGMLPVVVDPQNHSKLHFTSLTRFGLKIGSAVPVGIRGSMWHHHEGCIKAKRLVKSAWLSNQYLKSWSISPLTKLDMLYVFRDRLRK